MRRPDWTRHGKKGQEEISAFREELRIYRWIGPLHTKRRAGSCGSHGSACVVKRESKNILPGGRTGPRLQIGQSPHPWGDNLDGTGVCCADRGEGEWP